METLPRLKFDTADFAPNDRLDATADLWRNYLSFSLPAEARNSFFLRSNVWWVNDCTLVHSFAAPMTCSRPPPPDEESLVSISLLKSGNQNYLLGADEISQSSNAIHVCNHGEQTARFCKDNSEIIILYVHASRLELVPGRAVVNRTFDVKTPVGALLRSLLESLIKSVNDYQTPDAGVLADGICAFLRPILREKPDLLSNSGGDLRSAAIRHYIDQNIKNQKFSLDDLCSKFDVSRATLYRLFKEEEGVQAYIARRKTQFIKADLARMSPRRGLIRRVAKQYGFYDMSQFNRTFRRHIGTTPGSFVGSMSSEPTGSWDCNSSSSGDMLQRPLVISNSVCSVHV